MFTFTLICSYIAGYILSVLLSYRDFRNELSYLFFACLFWPILFLLGFGGVCLRDNTNNTSEEQKK